MILIFALTGGLVVGGLVLLVAELTRRAPAPGAPPTRAALVTGRLTDPKRIVIAVVCFLVVAVIVVVIAVFVYLALRM